jgi:hypothetical protein
MQQQPPSPSWNNSSIPHGFPATSYVFSIKKKLSLQIFYL